jgi:hypothetical protein
LFGAIEKALAAPGPDAPNLPAFKAFLFWLLN